MRSKAQEISVAVTALIALTLFAGAILILGQENRLFARKLTYQTNFPDAGGLRVGAPVTMAGVRVGAVTRIVLPLTPASRGIDVFVEIDEAYAPRVRQGTHAKQVTLQFIANEKAIELNPGDPLLPELAEGAAIPTEVQTEFIEQGRTIADALQEITIDMRDILQSIKNREGLIGRAISDPQFGRKGLVELESALASADQLLARANRGEGLLGKALADQAFATQLVQDLQAAGRGFAAVARRLEAGEGLLGAMTRGEEGVAVISDLKNLTASFQAVAKALQNGDGLAGLLLHDRVRAERIAANLDETLSRLASIARKVDEGQGTLGLLVNDRKLHDDVQQLVTGAKGRTLAGRVLRHYYERGAKQSEGSQPPPSDHSRPAGDPPPGGSY